MDRGRSLPNPRLTWSPARGPRSEAFDDTYFAREGGLAEKRHVFLGGCQLPAAWRDSFLFVIGELGFGTGLSFLATWDLWRKTRPPGGRLHYVAVEGHPLTPDELRECVAAWPALRHVGQDLLKAYPVPQRGFQRLILDDGQVILTLLFGDAAAMLAALEAQVDAWYLDGFAPDRNPAMWSAEVMTQLARLSKPGARLATYSVAGEVRRVLAEAGFDMHRAPGYGAKREMLRGTFRHGQPAAPRPLAPWFAHAPAARLKRGRAAVIGAGLAGCNVARAFALRGWAVTVYDAAASVAAGASGNPVGVLVPRVTGAPSVDGRFHAAAWRFALDSLEALADRGLPLLRDRCGALVLATDTEEDTRQAAIAADLPLPEPFLYRVSAREASELSGVALKVGGLYFPQAGWLGPGHVCRALLDGIEVRLGAAVAGLHRKSGVWTITGPNGDTLGDADVVVIANAIAAAELAATSWLPLQARRGQVTLLPPTAPCRNLHAVLVYGGYLTPAHNGRQCLGATFDWVDDPTAPVEADDDGHRRNLADLMAVFPDLKHDPDAVLNGRAAVRCTLPDHLPAAGPVPDDAAYRRDYAELRHGHPWARYPDASYHPGLYSLVGLGARGLVAAPLAAEILVSQVMGEPWPLERDLATALHPGRFLVRDLKRVKA